jgi:uncharacterized membrane protein
MAGPGASRFPRSGDGLEFERFVNFSDAIYAIALTLLAVGIGAPTIEDATSASDFLDGLWSKNPEIISFFLSFAVLGGFWLAHNGFVSRLAAVDPKLRAWNLAYLAFVAFLPFPTLLLGQFVENPAAIGFYAISVGAISALETVMLRVAYRDGLFRKPMPAPIANWSTATSFAPVLCFALSIPIAFINPILGMVTWALSIPAQIVLGRRKPEGADEYFA